MPDAFPDIIDAGLHVERPALGHGLQLLVDAVSQKAGPLQGAGHHQHIVPRLVRLLLYGSGEEVQVVEAVFVHLHRQVCRSIQREGNPPGLRPGPDAQGKGTDVHPVHGVEFREGDLHLHAALKVEAGHGRAAHVMHVHLYPIGLQLLPVLGAGRPDPQAVILLQHCASRYRVNPQLISFLCHFAAFLFPFYCLFINCLLFLGTFTLKVRIAIIKMALIHNPHLQKAGDSMPTNAEVIERLARKLERACILNDLKECRTLEEYQELTKKYETLCNDDNA